MSRERIRQILTILIFAFLAIAVFDITPYLVIIAMSLVFFLIIYEMQKDEEKRSRIESTHLMNQVKTSTSDVNLKQDQLYTLVANIPLPLVLLDSDGKAVLYNSFFEHFRRNDDDIELTYNKNDFKKSVHRFVNDAFIFEKEISKPMNIDGVDYEAISVPITTDGKFNGCVILFQDISKAKEKEQMQKQFIADASHELKTPISAIKGMVEILNREGFDDEEIRSDFLHQIEKENARLESIVQDLLQLSRLSNDMLVLKRESHDFTKIIDACVDSLEHKAREKNIEIVKDYQTHGNVFVDFEQMEVAINNLLGNAIAYSDHGTIYLRTYYDEDECYIFEIEDQGQGIEPDNIEKIFERFYRIDKARSRLSGGSGLGLSIVKSIIEAHTAEMEVHSEVGKGTTFKIKMKY